MGKKDKRVDAYIGKAADFAKPVLNHLRKLMHDHVPGVEETIKWGMPSFEYKGPFAGFASFKQHCVFGFWKTSILKDPKGVLDSGKSAMGSLGRMTGIKDLPPDKVIIGFIKQAIKLNDEGVKLPQRQRKEMKELPVPANLKAALSKNKKAKEHFGKFPPGQRKEYIVWITEAKTEETRKKRLDTAVEWISQGKIRNWKYAK